MINREQFQGIRLSESDWQELEIYSSRSIDSHVWTCNRMLKIFGIPADQDRTALEVLLNASQLAQHANMMERETVGGTIKLGIGMERLNRWEDEGILNFSLGLDNTRLFEGNLLLDYNGNLLTTRVQRHRFNQYYRHSVDTPEKERGDKFYRKVKRKTGLRAEAFGLLALVYCLADFVPNKQVVMFEADEQPKMLHLHKYREVYQEDVDSGSDFHKENLEEKLEEIENVRPMVDTRAMLAECGVSEEAIEEYNSRMILVPIEVIKESVRGLREGLVETQQFYLDILLDLEKA